MQGSAVLTLALASLAGISPVIASDGTASSVEAIPYPTPLDRPRLTHGYRSALGLKAGLGAAEVLGPGSATTQLVSRLAQPHAYMEPVLYTIERVPPALGLRSAERAAGIALRGSDRWISSLEASSVENLLTANRRTALFGQMYAPLTGGVGVSIGIRLSSLQTPVLGASSGDAPYGNGYLAAPGRADSSIQLGYQLQLNYLYGERNAVALSYSSRRESDPFRLGFDPLLSDSSQLSVIGEHWFSPSWAVRYDIPTPESGNLIRRQGLRLGVHYRF
jgi:hypothetical protein